MSEREEKKNTQPRRPSRRAVFVGAGGLFAGGAGGLLVGGFGGDASGPPEVPPLRFFTDAEAATVEAMAERVFPEDESGPGARDAGVMHYIDGRLAGAWGHGERVYTQGPFHEPTDSGHGYQLPLTPREVYRRALRRLDAHCRATYADRDFADLGAKKQDTALTALEEGAIDLGLAEGEWGFTSTSFFAMFLANVSEGLFCDPMHGGNRDMVGWKWVGFPGDPLGYGEPYAEHIGEWNVPYHVEPKGVR